MLAHLRLRLRQLLFLNLLARQALHLLLSCRTDRCLDARVDVMPSWAGGTS